MLLKSVWSGEQTEFPELNENISTDVLVVGGGITGNLIAYELSSRGTKVVLIDAERLACGSTGIATAKITTAQGMIYYDLMTRYGVNAPKAYCAAQSRGMDYIVGVIEKCGIDCDLIKKDAYVFCRSDKQFSRLREGLLCTDAPFESTVLPDAKVELKAVKMPDQYAFDPVKFVQGLPKNYTVYEHTPAVSMDLKSRTVTTPHGSIKADRIVIATRYPFNDEKGGYAMKLRPSMAFSMAVNERLTDHLILEDREDGLSLRPFDGGTIICGCDCRTGRAGDKDRFSIIMDEVRKLYGDITVKTFWCGEDCMTYDGMPLIGEWEPGKKGILIATGFNKWGMANSAVAANIIADISTGKENAFAGFFSPDRHIKGAFGAMLINAVHNMIGVLMGFLPTIRSEKSLKCGEAARVRTKHGVKCVYCDEHGVKHYTYGKCPHKGCKLVWNDIAKTWDCPCHGTRLRADKSE